MTSISMLKIWWWCQSIELHNHSGVQMHCYCLRWSDFKLVNNLATRHLCKIKCQGTQHLDTLLVASAPSSQSAPIALLITFLQIRLSIHLSIHPKCNSGMGNTAKNTGSIYFGGFFNARSLWVDNAHIFIFFSVCHVCWNRQKQTVVYCIS